MGTTARSRSRHASATEPGAFSQRGAARFLGVSVGYLRHSSCPKVRLPSNRPNGKPVIRYFRHAIEAWASCSREAQGGAPCTTATEAAG